MTAGKWPKASKANPCPCCGHVRRCHVRDDGRAGRCYRPDECKLSGDVLRDQKEDSTGTYRLWFLDPPTHEPNASAATPSPAPSRATSGQIDKVYSRLLEHCPMSPAAANELARARGLELDQVATLRFGRLPNAKGCSRILYELEREFGVELLRQVPGFFVDHEGRFGFQARSAGLIIPHFEGPSIVALQIRPDKTSNKGSKYFWFSSGGKGGVSVQAPYIVGDIGKSSDLVVVTEGAFKALAIAAKMETFAIGLPGVGSLEPAMHILREVGAKEVLLAFDADHAQKIQGRMNTVFSSLRSAVDKLRAGGLATSLLLWNRGPYIADETPKGVDDAISAGLELFELRGEEVNAYLTKVATDLGQLPPKEKEKEKEEKPISTFKRLKAKMEEVFTFFSHNGTAFLASKKGGTAVVLKDADLDLFWALEKASGGEAPSPEFLRSISLSKAAQVRKLGPFHKVHRRVAHLDGTYYLDLCRPDGRVVEMRETGWRVIDNPQGLFWKRKISLESELPEPSRDGDVELLGKVLSVKGPALKFLIAFLVAILRPEFSFPLLVLEGRAGAAKSTAARMLKFMIDPTLALVGALPKNADDVAVSCRAAHLVVFDNVDRIKPDMSDILCQVSTGSAIRKRAHYTDGDEAELAFLNPVIISGIEGIVDRADLASRAALVTLEPLRDEDRIEERELWALARSIRPRVLGGLLDAFCAGLANLEKTPKPKARNIDFARFMLAAENGLPWPKGQATEFLISSRNELYEQALWKDRVALAVIDLQARLGTWSGTMTDLLGVLRPPSAHNDDFWPTNGHKLTRRITQAGELLEYRGVEVVRVKPSNRGPIFRVASTRGVNTPSEAVSAAESYLFEMGRE